MSQEEKIRELERRIEVLENKNKNLGKILVSGSLASAGGVSAFFGFPIWVFSINIPVGITATVLGIISFTLGLHLHQMWHLPWGWERPTESYSKTSR